MKFTSMTISDNSTNINPESVNRSDLSEGSSGSGSLLYHNSNNTIDLSESTTELLTPYHRKQAFSLTENVKKFVAMFGLEQVGFLTLTFKDNVTDHKEAYRRFNSLRTNFLSKVFLEYMLVKERQKRGAWHFHLLVGLPADIRTGFKFDQVFPLDGSRPNYSSASPYLRSLWRELRQAMELYGFGRSELAPIRKTDDAVASYVGKYIEQNVVGKNVSGFEDQDKGVRLVSYSRKWPRCSTKFSWNSKGAKEWRRKVGLFAQYAKCRSMDQLSQKLGPKWVYFYSDVIFDMDRIEEALKQRRHYTGENYEVSEDGLLISGKTGEFIF